MKRSTMIAALATMVVLLAAVVASAQMMNMMGGDTKKAAEATTDNPDMMGMMKDMSSHCQMMSDNFANLEEHFDSMMKMDNMGELKKEMQKHHDMMISMHKQMSENRQMCSEMMSMMGSGGMHGQMMASGGMRGQKMGSCCPQDSTKKSESSDEPSSTGAHGHGH